MLLIGMLDSPYVRRTAISLQRLGLRFEHRAVSVFRHFPAFAAINPLVKAPTLVCDDGEVLMDSTLILDYAEALAALASPGRSLMPAALAERQHALRIIGLALAACEKSVQIYYERELRPEEKRHAPWVDRVTAQAHAAYDALEVEFQRRPPAAGAAIDQAGITAAVAWRFTRETVPDVVSPERCPTIAAYSAAAETLAEFKAAQHGFGTYPVAEGG